MRTARSQIGLSPAWRPRRPGQGVRPAAGQHPQRDASQHVAGALRGQQADHADRLAERAGHRRAEIFRPGQLRRARSSSQSWLARAIRAGTDSSPSSSAAAAISWPRRTACW